MFPSEPIRITVSKFKTFVLFFMVILAILYLHFRSQNKDELELLKVKHQEMQLMIRTYIQEMTYIAPGSEEVKLIDKKVAEFKKNLNFIEDDMKQKRMIWFLE
jgi:hypothetical protein